MFCIEKLKLNKFEKVSIPRNRDYFSRLGKQVISSSNSYSGDEPIIMNQSKIQQIDDYQRYADMKSKEMENDS